MCAECQVHIALVIAAATRPDTLQRRPERRVAHRRNTGTTRVFAHPQSKALATAVMHQATQIRLCQHQRACPCRHTFGVTFFCKFERVWRNCEQGGRQVRIPRFIRHGVCQHLNRYGACRLCRAQYQSCRTDKAGDQRRRVAGHFGGRPPEELHDRGIFDQKILFRHARHGFTERDLNSDVLAQLEV